MPIRIDKQVGESTVEVAYLCPDVWEMPLQMDALKEWTYSEGSTLEPGKYVADVGFCVRIGACGGGAVLSIETMSAMVNLGMELFFSEYD